MVEALGYESFFANGANEEYKDLPVPECFEYLFEMFMELYSFSGEDGITWQEIESYCHVRRLALTQFEIDYIIKIRLWADSQISEMREDSRGAMRKDENDE